MNYTCTMNDSKDLSLTIYNDNFALIKETRTLNSKDNISLIKYLDVPQLIETDSIIVTGVNIKELNYDYDLVSREKLMEKYIDKNIFLYSKEKDTKEEYKLLSILGGLMLENVHTKEILINPQGEIILPKLPDDLITKPALIWKIAPTIANDIKVSYLTKGLRWTSNYVLSLKNDTLQLSGWVNIENNSGATYENTKVKLIAGEVKRVENNSYSPHLMRLDECIAESRCANFQEEGFFDYHMYTLQHRSTLKNNQSKQINFIDVNNISYKRYYEFDSYNEKANIMLEFNNETSNSLGIPLPKGNVKVYKEDLKDNSIEFIGEDSIDHTPKDEIVTLHIGEAFDIVCERQAADYKKVKGYEYNHHVITIKNHKDEDILCKVNHSLYGDWEITECSDEFLTETIHNIVFWCNVPKNSTKKIEFKYKVNNSIDVNLN